MIKHRKTRRKSQKGGDWYNPMTWCSNSLPNSPKRTWSEWLSGTSNNLDTSLGNAVSSVSTGVGNAWDKTKNFISSDVDIMGNNDSQFSQSQVVSTQEPYKIGGKRKKHSRSMKGGKGVLGLTYYATPVSELKVAEPTSWQYYANGTNQYSIKGGSRRRRGRKSRQTHHHKRF